ANRRRDEVEEVANDPAENMEEPNVEEAVQEDFNWVQVEEEAKVQGESQEKQADEGADLGSGDQFYDVVDDERPVDEDVSTPEVPTPAVLAAPVQTSVQPKGMTVVTGVYPSGPSGHLPDFELIHLQAEFTRALQANTRFQELYQQLKSNPSTSPKP
ncbi:hypothetical protein Dimus_033562, partial [Dionaea muscipula]